MQDAQSTQTIAIKNNVKVCVPAPLKLITPYVLREQHDWFEDEIHFIRKLISPGMSVIDIGANYGLYTLSMAQLIGQSGRLWAFEPAQATSDYLRQSIATNGFDNIELIQAGLSNKIGEATFFCTEHSELNSLTQSTGKNTATETVKLLTLDHCQEIYNWTDIDFIKLDAEGEESNILEASSNILTTLSPLIMFELKHGDKINTPLIKQFGDMGYKCYCLLPGLNTLIPFSYKDDQYVDPYLLNLFCCKDDRAEQLEREGFLTRSWHPGPIENMEPIKDFLDRTLYGQVIQAHVAAKEKEVMDEFAAIITSYILSCEETSDMAVRTGYLLDSMQRLCVMTDAGEDNFARLASFARIASDAGERAMSVTLLKRILDRPVEDIMQEPVSLCLPAYSRYDSVEPEGDLRLWLIASVLEQYIIKHSYSTIYSGGQCLPLFKRLEEYGYLSEDMANRWNLVKEAFG